MPRYFGSPFGEIRGTIFGITCSRARGGIKVLKAYKPFIPTGSKKFIMKALNHDFSINKISIKQANSIRVFSLLNSIAYHIRNLLTDSWYPLTRGTILTPRNKFVKVNHPLLYYSIPNPKEFISPHNKPDLSKIFITNGRLEPAFIIDAHYDKGKKMIEVNWKSFYYNNAKEDDEALITLIYWNPPDHPLDLQGNLKVWIIRNAAARGHNHAQFEFRKLNDFTSQGSRGLILDPDEVGISARKGVPTKSEGFCRGRLPDKMPLTLYLSFKSKMKYYGYSQSHAFNLYSQPLDEKSPSR